MGEDLKQIELPISWCLVSHKEIADINPKILFTNIPEDLEVSFLPMSAVEAVTGKCDLSIIKTFKDVKKGYTPFINGDLIFAKITPCMENGKIAIVNNLANGLGFGSTEFHVSRLSALVNKYYFFYFFNQSIFKKEAKKYMTGSAGQLRVPKAYFENINIPFPPLAEQHRIVAKIEELFSELDKGIESLKKAQEQLKIYRQAVLKYAFEGKLTEKWREQQIREGKLESAESLLEKIKIERERLYQEQLKEWEQSIQQWEANGKQGKKPVKPKVINQISEKAELIMDRQWIFLSLEYFATFTGGGTPSKSIDSYWNNGNVAWVSPKDMKSQFITNTIDYITEEALDKSTTKLVKENSLLVVVRSAILRRTLPLAISKCKLTVNQDIQVITPVYVSPLYLYWFMTANEQAIREKCGKDGTTVESLDTTSLKKIPILIPSFLEQILIEEKIEYHNDQIQRLDSYIEQSINKAESLRQSILKQAFEGKLVPQDPNDEPAEKLLERIKQEKSQINQSLQQELNLEEI
jgi:type I restriction enzyme S subunit